MEQQVLIDALHNPPAIPVALVPGAVAKVVTKILDKTPIAFATTTALTDCTAIDLHTSGYSTLAITVETTYNAAATRGIKIHVLTSRDNVNWDTADWDSWSASFTAGASIRQTQVYSTEPAYLKVLVENLDPAQTITNTKVYSTAG